MEKSIIRKKVLPAAQLETVDLALLEKLLVELYDGLDPNLTFEIKTNDDRFKFEGYKDLLENISELPEKIKEFEVGCYANGNHLTIQYRNSLFITEASVRANGSSEQWSVGAIEIIHTFFSKRKKWYRKIHRVPLGWALILIGNLPSITNFIFDIDIFKNKFAIAGFFISLSVLAFLFLFKAYLFPMFNFAVSKDVTFIRKYSSEIGLGLSLIAIMITIVGWFVKP